MEIPVPSIETLKLCWDWVLKNLQLWFRVLRRPAEFLATIDLESTDTLIAAIQFAVFPIVLSAFIQLPDYLLANDPGFGFIGYFILCAVLYPASLFLASVAQRFSAILIRGKGSFIACTIATLYAAAFWPLLEVMNLSELGHRATYVKLFRYQTLELSDFAYLLLDLVVLLAVGVYLIVRFVPMTEVVHKVGRTRATMICLLTILFLVVLADIFIMPFQNKMLLGLSF